MVYGGLVVGVWLWVLMGNLADSLLLFPSTHPLAADHGQTIAYGDGTLHMAAWWPGARADGALPEGPEVSVAVVHFTGNGSRAEEDILALRRQWNRPGVVVFAVNYPGYGASSGPARLREIVPAARAAAAHVRGRYPGARLIGSGNSIGCTAVLRLAAEGLVDGLVLVNPPPLHRIILRQHGWWNLWVLAGPVSMMVPQELNALRSAPLAVVPAVMLTARNDEIVGVAHQDAVAQAYGGRLTRLYHDGGHNDLPLDTSIALREAIEQMLAE